MSSPALPPGPNLFGTFDFIRNPFRFLDTCARRYGDWFTVRVPGVAPFVFTSDPSAVREIFLGDPDSLHAGEANRPLGAFMGERSSLFLDAPEHLRQRRLLLPAFHGEQMASHAHAMRDAADNAIASWPRGQPFPIHPQMRAITFETIIRAVFGFENDAAGTELRALLKNLFALYSSRLGTLFSLPAMQIDAGRFSPWGRALGLTRQIDSILYAEFARRRKEGVEGRADVLSMLLAARYETGQPLPDNVIRDEMYTLMLAGHETTAATMAWIVNRLVTRPDVMDRARAEVFSVLNGEQLSAAHVGKIKYLEAVINETMRLDPVVPNIGRGLKARDDNRRPPATSGRDDRAMHLPGASTPRTLAKPHAIQSRPIPRIPPNPLHLLPLRRRLPPMPGRRLRNLSNENRNRRNPGARRIEKGGRLRSARNPPRHSIRAKRRPPSHRRRSKFLNPAPTAIRILKSGLPPRRWLSATLQ